MPPGGETTDVAGSRDDRDRKGSVGEGGADSDADDGPSFADLVGADTQPIRGGPDRVRPEGARSTAMGAAGGPRDDAPGGPRGFRFPDPADPHRAAAAGVSDRTLANLARGTPAPEERLDLHGTRGDAAGPLLARRLESARSRGLRCLLVVHGRGRHSPTGEAVLRDGLPDWLTRGPAAPHVLAYAPAPVRLGGEGATLVLLRKRTTSQRR